MAQTKKLTLRTTTSTTTKSSIRNFARSTKSIQNLSSIKGSLKRKASVLTNDDVTPPPALTVDPKDIRQIKRKRTGNYSKPTSNRQFFLQPSKLSNPNPSPDSALSSVIPSKTFPSVVSQVSRFASSFLKALSLYQAHHGFNPSIEVSSFIPFLEGIWGARKPTLLDIQRCLKLFNETGHSLFGLTDHGQGKFFIELKSFEACQIPLSKRLFDDSSLLSKVINIIHTRWNQWRSTLTPDSNQFNDPDAFIASLPVSTIDESTNKAKLRQYDKTVDEKLRSVLGKRSSKTRQTLITSFSITSSPSKGDITLSKDSQSSNTLTKCSSLPLQPLRDPLTSAKSSSLNAQPSHNTSLSPASRLLSILSKARIQSLENLEQVSSGEQITANLVRSHLPDITSIIELMVLSKGLPTATARTSFPLSTVTTAIQSSLPQCPLAKDDIRVALNVIEKESNGWLRVLSFGQIDGVVIQGHRTVYR